MPDLLIHPRTGVTDGRVIDITPSSAGWNYVGFAVDRYRAGNIAEYSTQDREHCVVILSGDVTVLVGATTFACEGNRKTPFDSVGPYAIYVPPRATYQVTAVTDVEIAICSGPAEGKFDARLIDPADLTLEQRGSGTNRRMVRDILPESELAESLLVVEVVTPGGHWSSYPPHKHDMDSLPDESMLEETYYHRLAPEQGFAFQRVYTDDRSIDETMSVSNGDVVLVPEGYHPVGAPHGYDLYYLNVMAGPNRRWCFRNDPDHDWIAR